ncbi:ankyrin repeat domain-containing protein [Sorangium sp. So ce367]|uniref:ankyrin repeat domain-containing protein n=1 Tax=Sorangium sp. So ce367 TaxID=3133305 RepID=UPI003F621A30
MSSELFAAIEAHDVDRLARLLREQHDFSSLRPEWPHWTPLHAAIEELEHGGSIQALVLLLRHGAQVDTLDREQDSTPLLMAVFRGQREAMHVLLAAGADPNVVGAEGDSPLRWCVQHRDLAGAALLLRCGAHQTIDGAGGPTGRTALGWAAHLLDLEMIRLLLAFGADPEAQDIDRRTARERLPRDASQAATLEAAAALLSTQPTADPGP